jgi:uncharacterized membrane protein YphA (DoxX/SURF4 family)
MEASTWFNGLRVALPVVGLMALSVPFLRATWAERDDETTPAGVDGDLYQGRPFADNVNSDTVSLWALTIVLSVLFVVSGLPKIGGAEAITVQFAQWGYEPWVKGAVGGLEVFAALFLLLPVTAFWAAGVLSVVMVGAMYTHATSGELATAIAPALCLMGLFYVMFRRAPGKGYGVS